MNKLAKKVAGTLLVCTWIFSLVGCGTRVETKPTASVLEENITLNVWHLWTTGSEANGVSFGKALEMYKAEHPNVTIEIDATENEAYKTKIKTAISANEAPDVFFAWGAGFSQPFIDAGQVLPIEEYLPADALTNLQKSTLKNFTYDNKLYGIPYISWVGILYCNQEMFDAASVKTPDTMEELYVAIKAFRARGIIPFTVGAKDAWNAMFFQNIATVRMVGTDVSMQALQKQVSYDQPAFVEGAQIVSDLLAAGAFDRSALALTYDEAKNDFLSGETPMMYIGSWFASEIENPEFSTVVGKVVAKNFPGIEGGQFNNQFLGGAIDGFMVNSNTKYKEEAAEFVAYIAEKMSRDSFLGGAGVPTWNIDVKGEPMSPLVQQIVDLTNESEGYIVAWDTFLSGSDVTTHLSLVQELFAGTKTPKEFTEGMQKLNE